MRAWVGWGVHYGLCVSASAFAAPVWQPTGIINDAMIAFAESGDTLFGGTHFGGLKSSLDGGKTWKDLERCEAVEGASVPAVFAAPGLLAAAYEGKGICFSRDAGRTWETAHSGLPFQPFIRDFESVGTWLLAGAQLASGGSVLYRRPMFEETRWSALGNGFDTSVQAVEKMARDDQGKVYAAVGRRKGDGTWIYVSADTGLTWNAVDSLLPGPVYDLAWADGFLIAATQQGVFRSPNQGATWEACGPDFASTPAYALSARAGLVVAGAGHVVYRSEDAAGSWLWLPDGLPGGDVSVLAVWAGKHTLLASISPSKGVFISEITTTIRPAKSRRKPRLELSPSRAWDAIGRRRAPTFTP
jgi:photosystem II stability/assembly factor-like uncharacterized protein